VSQICLSAAADSGVRTPVYTLQAIPEKCTFMTKISYSTTQRFFLNFFNYILFSLHQPRLFKDVKMSESLRFVSMRVNADAFFPEKIN